MTKKDEYREAQVLYNKHPEKLADMVFEDREWTENGEDQEPDPEEVRKFYSNLWSTSGVCEAEFPVENVTLDMLKNGTCNY